MEKAAENKNDLKILAVTALTYELGSR